MPHAYRCAFATCDKPNRLGIHTHQNKNGWTSSIVYADPRLLPPVLREHADTRWAEPHAYSDRLLFDKNGNPYADPRLPLPKSYAYAMPLRDANLRADSGDGCLPDAESSAGFWGAYYGANRRGMPWN